MSGNLCTAQETPNETKHIDALILIANQMHVEGKSKQLLTISNDIISRSNKLKYDRGMVYGYYYIASCFSFDGKFTKSNEYLKKAQTFSKYLDSDYRQNYRINGLLADNYRDLELYQLSISSYHRSMQYLKHIKLKTVIDSLSLATNYDNLSVLYNAMNLGDSAYYYLNKDKAILKNITFEDAYIEKSSCYLGLGTYHYKLNHIDSATFYYDQSLDLLKGKNHPFEISALYSKAEIYAKTDDSEALKYFELALSKAKEHDLPDLQADIYKAIGEIYSSRKNYKEANWYQEKYMKLKEQLNRSRTGQRDFAVNEVLNQQKQKFNNNQTSNTYNTYAVLGVFTFLLVIALYLVHKYRTKNEKITTETELLLNEKETIISKKEEETQVLKLKVNESFEEIVQLAKDNSPEFFSRFQEVYPNFVTNIMGVNDKMRLSELTLCAYIFLGFNTKDISSYTFKSVHTIRSRKYNLRKKFDLSPEENMELWLKNLPNNPTT